MNPSTPSRWRLHRVWLVLPLVLTAACSGIPDGPEVQVMPGRGRTLASFQIDDNFCRDYAVARLGSDNSDYAVAQFSATAGAVGAAFGGLVGGLVGGPRGATLGAANGASSGGGAYGYGYGQSAGSVRQKFQDRYDNGYVQCMQSRGHRTPVNNAWPGPSAYTGDRLQIGVPRF